MYYGRDAHLVQLIKMFKTIHTRDGFEDKYRDLDPNKFDYNQKIRDMFNEAMASLKYMGYVSATRQSTFIFKKNIFGKPKYYSTDLKINESAAKRI